MVPTSSKGGPTTNRRRICRISRLLQSLCTGIAIAVPIAAALLWGTVSVGSTWLPSLVDGMPIVLTPATRVAAFFCTMVPGAVLVWAFMILRRLFGLYATGRIFSSANVRCFRRLGIAALAWMATDVLYSALLSVSLTMGNPSGQRFFAIEASGVNLTALFAGVVLLVISWVMEEARRLDEDQSQIV